MIDGRIVNSARAPAENLRVVAFDKDTGGENRLGEATSGADGSWRIEYTEASFRRSANERGGPDLFVRVYDEHGGLLFTSKTQRNAAAESRIDIKLPESKFVVRGRVTGAVRGLVVVAHDCDLRSEQPLGKPFTLADDGSYSLEYTAAEFARAEKGTADLRISVSDADGQEIGTSDILFNAGRDVTIDLTVTVKPSISELEQYLRDIEPVLQEVALTALDDKDIDFISRDTGIDAGHVRLLVLASKLATGSTVGTASSALSARPTTGTSAGSDGGIPAAVYYGWFRLGLPTVTDALWAKSLDELKKTLQAAIDRRVIPAMTDAQLKALSERIARFKLEYALRVPSPGSTAALGDQLDTMRSPPTVAQQLALAGAAGSLRPDDPKLAEKIAAVPGFDGDAAAVARTLRLGALTGKHLPLMTALQDRFQDTADDGGTLHALAQIRPDEWIDLAYAHGTPDGASLTPPEFAATLAAQVEQLHPTPALAARLASGGAFAQHPLLAGVTTFLGDNPGFDLVAANLNTLEKSAELRSGTDVGQLGRGLLALQRFNALGVSWSDTAILLDSDLHSPQQVLSAGPAQLAQMLGGKIPSARITALHEQATELHAVTFAAVSAALAPLSAPDIVPGATRAAAKAGPVGLADLPRYLRAGGEQFDPNKYKSLGGIDKDTLSNVVATVSIEGAAASQPTLQYLFGSQDACTCGHCSSVLSPAAYFVDVMQFIRAASSSGDLLERLLQRRPDLQDIELSCSNSNSEVPAIDLALETLENAVALPLPIDLPAGTTLDDELRDGLPVGPVVRKALEKTVRHFTGEGQATFGGLNGDGSSDWAITDLHRRWTVNARAENGLLVFDGIHLPRRLDTSGIDLAGLIAALDGGAVPDDARAAFANSFSPNAQTGYADYKVIVTARTAGHSWRVQFGIVQELSVDAGLNQLSIRAPGGQPWTVKRYQEKTIAAVRAQLADGTVPELIDVLLRTRFPGAGKLTAKKSDLPLAEVWNLAGLVREVTLNFAPAHLDVASLAYQSGDPAVDAIAEPENHNPEAYERLKQAVFPWTLPLDLPLEETRQFVARARSSRRELIELTTPVGAALGAAWAQEMLGLSAAESALIVGVASADELYAEWGIQLTQKSIVDAATGQTVSGTPPLSLLRNVSILMQQARLSFEQLQLLIESSFVTLAGSAPLTLVPRFTCKPIEMNLIELSAGHLGRLHRFVRLWRRLEWSLHDLDLAIRAFDGLLTPVTLLGLAWLKALRQQTGLPVGALVTIIDRLETRDWTDYLAEDAPQRQSLYSQIFQREALRPLADFAAFALRPDALELASTPDLGISAHADYVGRCIGVGASVVGAWVAAGSVLGVVDKLELANLSRLSGAAWLCNALSLDPQRLEDVLELLGPSANPFQPGMLVSARLDALVELVRRYRNLASAAIDAETLRFVLEHHEPPGSSITLSVTQVAQFAAAARLAIGSIADAPAAATATAAELAALADATRVAREDAAVSALAASLGRARELVDELLRVRLRNPADATRPAIDALLADTAVEELVVRSYKSVLVCEALGLKKADFEVLRESGAATSGFTALDFNSLPVVAGAQAASITAFEQLVAFAQLRKLVPKGTDLLHAYALPAAGAAAWSAADARQALATGFAMRVTEVQAAANQIGVTADDQYRDPIAVTALVKLLAGLGKLGATVGLATGLAQTSPDVAAALGARELLRGKYGDSQWRDLIKPIEDKLRERQRGALVDLLIARGNLRDANDLYEYFLIDVQTGSCMKTTRLLQATAAVQLFVQRVLLNLEPGASLSADKRAQWDWMRNYRVWEANRKVFLFPENWLLPELRDDKTATFRAMEGMLSENDPTPDSMRSALLGYLEDLADLGQMRTIAMHVEPYVIASDGKGHDITARTLYVIGRTPNTPYRYFWRSCDRFGSPGMSWSGWEALDLENANDFIMPFIFEGDLHVAWPMFHRAKEELREDHDTARLLWEVQLAWARRTNKGWVKRKLAMAPLTGIERLSKKDETASFDFRLSKQVSSVPGSSALVRETIKIECFAATEAVTAPSADPDLTSVDKDPYGDFYSTQYGQGYQWNVSLKVRGAVYKYFKRPGDEGGNYYAPYPGLQFYIKDIYQKEHEFTADDVHKLDDVSHPTDANGLVRFDFLTSKSGKNGNEGLINGGSVKLLIVIPGQAAFDKTVSLVRQQNAQNEYALNWTWNIVHLIEDPSLEGYYDQQREVKLEKCGEFTLETGKDLTAELTTSTAAYVSNVDSFNAEVQSLSLPIQSPASAIRATHRADFPDAAIWYVTASNGASDYLLIPGTDYQQWPDGQPFASAYRIGAETSALTLFSTENQRHLHLDPAANTFDRQAAYANYDWELFLHAPLAIADFLMNQQRFEDARRWLHVVFDPTTDEIVDDVPQYWRFLPFLNGSQPAGIAQLLTWLAEPGTQDSAAENALSFQVAQWRRNPFMPHLVARLRPSAYQWHTFFAYLSLLINWGDQLFRRDTRESVNEATLLYVLAAKLLGPRPRTIRPAAEPAPQTYRGLSTAALDDFSNAWVQYADLPGAKKLLASAQAYAGRYPQYASNDRTNYTTGYQTHDRPDAQLLTSFGLLFCIPQNERVGEFYDLIEKRLFDIRHCRNIEGIFRDLPLYDPPIDPLLLIRARAAGLDIATVVSDLYAPLPNYRFTFTVQKALELCAEVKSLGGALLAALEKQDAEALTLLRSKQEIAMLKLARDVRQKQVEEAAANVVALQQSQATINERFSQFQKLLGKTSITRGQDGLPVVEQSSSLSVSTDPIGAASGLALSRMEVEQLRLTAIAHVQTQIAGSVQVVAGIVGLIPNIFAGTPFAGQTSGGTNFGIAASAVAKGLELIASDVSFVATQAGTFGSYERRQDEWIYQSKLALAELKQLDKQILAAQIRQGIAQKELDNHDQQIANAIEVDDFMRDKFTNRQLFRWMSSQIAEVYFRIYQLALDQARRAERTHRRELGLDDATPSYVRSDHWDGLKSGLLAGERLHHDLKRLESAYLEQNGREFEMTRHVSLLQLDPIALIRLRESGACDFEIPETLFDLDCPGHYMRRIKTVSLSIPCIAGPYANVNATLRLKSSETRVKVTADAYPRLPPDQADSRFRQTTAPTMAIVTSNAQQDSGMFESNLRDERYLPFEGAGAISSWRLELPNELRQFNYDTISDVILHIRYTSRADAELQSAATAHLTAQITTAEAAGLVRLFSIRHEFPSAWAKFIATTIDGNQNKTAELSLDLRPEHYPFWSRGRLESVEHAQVFARVGEGIDEIGVVQNKDGSGNADALTRPTDPDFAALLVGTLTKLRPSSPVSAPNAPLKLYFQSNSMTDLWLAVKWKGAP
jgi:hypothetical protein